MEPQINADETKIKISTETEGRHMLFLNSHPRLSAFIRGLFRLSIGVHRRSSAA
jgi:hypothetical protein